MNARSRMHAQASLLIWTAGMAAAIGLFAATRFPLGGRTIVKISGVDAVCYFATAHSLLFDGDFDLSNQFARLTPDPNPWTGVQPETGKPGSPFAIGFSLLQIPFIAAGYGLASLGQARGDTFSIPVVLLYYIGLIFWTCLGLVLFQRLVRTALEDDPRTNRIAAAVTLGMWPATTLCYYTFSAMAHVAAFTASVVFLLSWWKAKTSTAWALWFGCGAALGVLSLCRWQDFLFVAVPIVHDLQRRLRRDLTFDRSWLLSRAAAVAGFTVVFWPQLVQWKSVYGAWLAMPRGATVLEFPPQHVMHALVSTQHGWFVWTPAAALGLAGLIWSCRMSRVAPALLAAVVCEVWLVGALQENWDGHVAFGMRYLTSTCSLLGLGLALAMARVAPRVRLATLALASACAAFTLVFGVQYRLDLLPKRDRLTVDELVADKLHLRRAVRRSRAVMEAKQLLDEGRPAEAAARIEFAKQAFGEGRDILQAQAAAYARLGDGPRRMAAQAELDRLLASRLF